MSNSISWRNRGAVPSAMRLKPAGTRLFVASVLCATASAGLLMLGKHRLDQSSQRLGHATADFEQQQQAAASADRRAMAEHRARELLGQVDQMGLSQAGWGQRRLDVRQEPMSRTALNALLAELRPDANKLFAPTAFEFSVQSPEEDLFSSPPKPGTLLVVTLKGRLIFKTTGAPTPAQADPGLVRS